MSLVKVRLLNDGGFTGFVNTKFPVEVLGQLGEVNGAVVIRSDELARVGYDVVNYMSNSVYGTRTFVLGSEAKLI